MGRVLRTRSFRALRTVSLAAVADVVWVHDPSAVALTALDVAAIAAMPGVRALVVSVADTDRGVLTRVEEYVGSGMVVREANRGGARVFIKPGFAGGAEQNDEE